MMLIYQNLLAQKQLPANEDEIRQAAVKNGMVTLRDAGNERVLDGTTSIEEILRSTVEDL